jgi:hypothetical protein
LEHDLPDNQYSSVSLSILITLGSTIWYVYTGYATIPETPGPLLWFALASLGTTIGFGFLVHHIDNWISGLVTVEQNGPRSSSTPVLVGLFSLGALALHISVAFKLIGWLATRLL